MFLSRLHGHRLLKALILMMICGLTSLAAAEFEPSGFRLEDRAVLIAVDEGVRRVRLEARNAETGAWEIVTVAHLDGRAGHMKLRLPDNLPLGELRCAISRSDPFPASFYEGSTSFSATADQSNESRGLYNASGPEDATKTDAPSGVTVEESDIWKWRDRTLYFFNTYRGLQVFDLTDLSNPRQTAALRLPAVGEQMYLAGDDHVVLLANNWYNWYGNGSATSEIVLVRHADEELAVTDRFEVEGTFVESRMVGSTLYAVTRIWEQTQDPEGVWQVRAGLKAYVIDLADASNPTQGEPLELMGDENGYFYNAVVTATPDYLFVIPTIYDNTDWSSHSEVHIIDISDPDTPLEVRSRIRLRGRLNDKFKLREQDGILTTITQLSGNSVAARLTSVENFNLNAAGSESPPLMGSVTLAPGETVRATRFDGDRLYVVTFRQIDPLFMVDLSNPGKPTVLAELDVPGWSTYLEPMGSRLLSVGVEDRRVAVSLFDVEKPESLSMLERVYLGEEDRYSWSEANYNEKAVGLFRDEGLLVLPFSGYTEGTYRTQMQLIDVGTDSLTKRGVIGTEFNGRRSQLFDSSLVAISGRELHVINVGDRDQPEVIDQLSVAWPVDTVASIGDEYLAQFENGYWGWWDGQSRPTTMRITRTEDVDTVVTELEIGIGGQVAGVIGDGEYLYLVTARPNVREEKIESGTIWEYETTYTTHVLDVSDPEAPAVLASVDSTIEGFMYWSQFRGDFLAGGELLWYPSNTGSNGLIWGYPEIDFGGRGDIWWPYYPSGDGTIIITRIDDPAAPEVIATMPLIENEENTKIYRESGPVFLESETLTFGYLEGNWQEDRYQNIHFLQQIDLSDPSNPSRGKRVNAPGLLQHFLATESGGDVLFTTRQKIEFDESSERSFWSPDVMVEASVFDGLNAYLVDQVEIEDGAYTPITGYDRFLLRPKNPLWRSSTPPEASLQVIEWSLDEGKFKGLTDIELDAPSQSLMQIGDLLFAFGSGGVDAIAVHRLPEEPTVVSFRAAALSYFWGARSIVLSSDESVAWIPVGIYGVESLDLSELARGLDTMAIGRDELQEWIPIDLSDRHVVPASANDFIGPIPEGYGWRLQPAGAKLSYATWADAHFNPNGDPDPDLPLPSDDSDGDGWTNAAEFALGTAPENPNSYAKPETRLLLSDPDGTRHLSYTFTVNPAASGVSVESEISPDLVTWTPATATDGFDVVDDGWVVSVRRSQPIENDQKWFIRLRFDIADEK
jgi:hypothetical protein